MRVAPSWMQVSCLAARCGARALSCAKRERIARLQNMVTSSAKPVRCRERAGVGPVFRSSVELRQIKTSINKRRKRNAGKRRVTTAASCDAARARRSAHACRRSTAALTSGSISSQRLSFRPGFLGRGLNGRYPPSPVPAQGCTSHPGRNAGRHDAQAARKRTANPPAGTALAPTARCASAPCPSRSEDWAIICLLTSFSRSHMLPPSNWGGQHGPRTDHKTAYNSTA